MDRVTYPYGEMVAVGTMVKDRFGARTLTGTRQVGPCAFAPFTPTEVEDFRDTTTRRGTLYAPAGESFAATEVVVFADGTQWEVVGGSDVWRSPFTGWYPGVAVALTKVSG